MLFTEPCTVFLGGVDRSLLAKVATAHDPGLAAGQCRICQQPTPAEWRAPLLC